MDSVLKKYRENIDLKHYKTICDSGEHDRNTDILAGEFYRPIDLELAPGAMFMVRIFMNKIKGCGKRNEKIRVRVHEAATFGQEGPDLLRC